MPALGTLSGIQVRGVESSPEAGTIDSGTKKRWQSRGRLDLSSHPASTSCGGVASSAMGPALFDLSSSSIGPFLALISASPKFLSEKTRLKKKSERRERQSGFEGWQDGLPSAAMLWS